MKSKYSIRVKAGVHHFLINSMNPTGFAQVIVERNAVGDAVGDAVRRYAIGDDVLAQDDTTNGFASLLADGHGSTRQLYKSATGIDEYYDYDAYGQTFAWNLDDPSVLTRPSTDLLYAGEQWDTELGMQYL